MSVDIHLDTARLDQLAQTAGMTAREVMLDLAFGLEAETQNQITVMKAVDTGAMRGSVFTEKVSGGKVVARVGPTVDYAVHVHFGARGRAGRPFLTTAADIVALRVNDGTLWRRLVK